MLDNIPRRDRERDCHNYYPLWRHKLLITKWKPQGDKPFSCQENHHQMRSHHSGISGKPPHDASFKASHNTVS